MHVFSDELKEKPKAENHSEGSLLLRHTVLEHANGRIPLVSLLNTGLTGFWSFYASQKSDKQPWREVSGQVGLLKHIIRGFKIRWTAFPFTPQKQAHENTQGSSSPPLLPSQAPKTPLNPRLAASLASWSMAGAKPDSKREPKVSSAGLKPKPCSFTQRLQDAASPLLLGMSWNDVVGGMFWKGPYVSGEDKGRLE